MKKTSDHEAFQDQEDEFVDCECEQCKEKRLYHKRLKKLEKHIVSYIA